MMRMVKSPTAPFPPKMTCLFPAGPSPVGPAPGVATSSPPPPLPASPSRAYVSGPTGLKTWRVGMDGRRAKGMVIEQSRCDDQAKRPAFEKWYAARLANAKASGLATHASLYRNVRDGELR